MSEAWDILVESQYIFYSVLAWIVIFCRAFKHKLSKAEIVPLVVYGLFMLAILAQLMVEQKGHLELRDCWGHSLLRYFASFAPILWIWAAVGFFEVFKRVNDYRRQSKIVGTLILTALIAFGLWHFHDYTYKSIKRQFRELGGRFNEVSREAAEFIKKDYGDRKLRPMPYVLSGYRLMKGPAVVGERNYLANNLRCLTLKYEDWSEDDSVDYVYTIYDNFPPKLNPAKFDLIATFKAKANMEIKIYRNKHLGNL